MLGVSSRMFHFQSAEEVPMLMYLGLFLRGQGIKDLGTRSDSSFERLVTWLGNLVLVQMKPSHTGYKVPLF